MNYLYTSQSITRAANASLGTVAHRLRLPMRVVVELLIQAAENMPPAALEELLSPHIAVLPAHQRRPISSPAAGTPQESREQRVKLGDLVWCEAEAKRLNTLVRNGQFPRDQLTWGMEVWSRVAPILRMTTEDLQANWARQA